MEATSEIDLYFSESEQFLKETYINQTVYVANKYILHCSTWRTVRKISENRKHYLSIAYRTVALAVWYRISVHYRLQLCIIPKLQAKLVYHAVALGEQ